MLRCASPLVPAAYEKVRLTPRISRALPQPAPVKTGGLLTKPSHIFIKELDRNIYFIYVPPSYDKDKKKREGFFIDMTAAAGRANGIGNVLLPNLLGLALLCLSNRIRRPSYVGLP
jgi:hypothetical protein